MRLEARPGEDKRIAECLSGQDTLPDSPLSSSACGWTRTVECLPQVGRRDTRLHRVPNRRLVGYLNREYLGLPNVGYRTLFSLPFPVPVPLPFAGRTTGDVPRLPHWLRFGVGSHGRGVPRP